MMLPSLDTEVKDSTDWAIVGSALSTPFEAPSDRGRNLQTMEVPVGGGGGLLGSMGLRAGPM